MVTIHIDRWNDNAVFTGWFVQSRSRLADLLKVACPTIHLTDRKRIARQIIKRECFFLEPQNAESGHRALSFLQALGALFTFSEAPAARRRALANAPPPRGRPSPGLEASGSTVRSTDNQMKTTRIVTVAAFLLFMPISSWARIGESTEQLETRYGPPVQTTVSSSDISFFAFKGYFVAVIIHDGKSVVEIYSRKDGSKVTEEDVQMFLQANSSGKEWRSNGASEKNGWTLDDGSKDKYEETYAFLERSRFTVGTYHGMLMKSVVSSTVRPQKDTSGF